MDFLHFRILLTDKLHVQCIYHFLKTLGAGHSIIFFINVISSPASLQPESPKIIEFLCAIKQD